MEVRLIAFTQLNRQSSDAIPYPLGYPWTVSLQHEPEQLVEFAGRVCYRSTDKLGADDAWLAKRVAEGHDSILEHVSFSFLITGISRACMAQLTRHRLCSFSVESLRYCRPTDMITPASVAAAAGLGRGEWHGLVVDTVEEYTFLVDHGIPEEDARYLLPLGTCTTLVMSCNARQLRHIIRTRALNRHAQWEIRAVARELLRVAQSVAPGLFADIESDSADS